MMKLNINLPVDMEKIINRLEKNGCEAYAVGGCVRDSLLGTSPKDWDICTDARPEQTMECFKDLTVIETGLKHGTITVRMNSQSYEITTYRADGEYLDNRRPDSVRFVDSLLEDLSRRDFTINAMAYNSKTGLKDFYGGCEDLTAGIIRCVGDADVRFGEDALRIMRALRFASVLGFEIEKSTSKAIHKNKKLLEKIASERINVELCKLLCGKGAVSLLDEYSDVFAVLIPEITPMFAFEQNNPHHHATVWKHVLQSMESADGDLLVRLALLFHDIGKPKCYTCDEGGIGHFYGHGECGADMATQILRNLKFDNLTVSKVCELVKYHDIRLESTEKSIRRWLNRIGEEQLKRLFAIQYADISGQSEYMRTEKLEKLGAIVSTMNSVLTKKQCYCLKDLSVNGKDLIEIGITDGKIIGETLNFLLEGVIDERFENDKKILINQIKSNDKLQHNF